MRKILVIAKDNHNRTVVVSVLRSFRWQVTPVIKAEEGVQYRDEVEKVVYFRREATFEEMRQLFPDRELIPLSDTLSMLTYARVLVPSEESRPALVTRTRT